MPELLLHLSIPHSGSSFLRLLLGSHKSISPASTDRQLCIAKGEKYFGPGSHDPDYHKANVVLDALKDSSSDNVSYCQLGIYTHSRAWFPLIFNNEVPTKIVAPIRSPLLTACSYYKYGNKEDTKHIMGHYRLLLELISILDVCVFPIDVYATMQPTERYFKIKERFLIPFNLPEDENFSKAVIAWRPENAHPFDVISDEIVSKLRQRISDAGLYEKLKSIGISYYQDEQHDIV